MQVVLINEKQTMKRKRVILLLILCVIISGVWYGLNEYNRKPADLLYKKPDFTVTVSDLINEFESDDKTAGSKYSDKVLAVKGILKEILHSTEGYAMVVLSRGESMSSVRCSVNEKYKETVKNLDPGQVITVKGAFTGFDHDDLLGSDVFLNRCVVMN